MPKGQNQKLKLYYLAKIMLEKTDDDHYLTMPEILEALRSCEVTADRKSIYTDLRDLEHLGVEVEGERNPTSSSASWRAWSVSTRPGSCSARSTCPAGSRP